jgi:hypothetical protein
LTKKQTKVIHLRIKLLNDKPGSIPVDVSIASGAIDCCRAPVQVLAGPVLVVHAWRMFSIPSGFLLPGFEMLIAARFMVRLLSNLSGGSR